MDAAGCGDATIGNMRPAMDKPDAAQLKVPCEVYSRIVGYLRPLRDWNKAKRVEYEERKAFVIGDGAQQKKTDVCK